MLGKYVIHFSLILLVIFLVPITNTHACSSWSVKKVLGKSNKFDGFINAYSKKYGIDSNLVRAVISAESCFNEKVVSVKGAAGLMQLMPDTADRFNVKDRFEAEDNIEGGIRYLSWLKKYFDNDIDLVLAAYNSGEGTVNRYKGIPPYKETKLYVKKVTNIYLALGSRELSKGIYHDSKYRVGGDYYIRPNRILSNNAKRKSKNGYFPHGLMKSYGRSSIDDLNYKKLVSYGVASDFIKKMGTIKFNSNSKARVGLASSSSSSLNRLNSHKVSNIKPKSTFLRSNGRQHTLDKKDILDQELYRVQARIKDKPRARVSKKDRLSRQSYRLSAENKKRRSRLDKINREKKLSMIKSYRNKLDSLGQIKSYKPSSYGYKGSSGSVNCRRSNYGSIGTTVSRTTRISSFRSCY